MNNEDKARELQRNDVCCVWNDGCPNVRTAAMKMAEWKDEQFNEFINSMGCFIRDAYKHYKESRTPVIDNKRDFYLQQHPEIIREVNELAAKLSYSFNGEVTFNTSIGQVIFKFK